MDEIFRWAYIPEPAYRYFLLRQWGALLDAPGPKINEDGVPIIPGRSLTIGWVMCNPSTADGLRDDPTIRKLIKYSQAWGYERLWVANLYARRSPDVAILRKYAEAGQHIIGPDNDKALKFVHENCRLVVWAWGNVAQKLPGYRRRVEAVKALARLSVTANPKGRVGFLARNGDGTPSHPLYLRDDITPTLFAK